jgi:dephospho-CoA kinase
MKNLVPRERRRHGCIVVGLTGGIASGKTTVARIFQNLGADVIDADSLGHQLLQDDLSVKRKLVATFGRCILNGEGEIDRSRLGCIVFDNPDYLRALNELVHPPLIERIKTEIEQKVSGARISCPQKRVVVVDAALLIELDLTHIVDLVILVYADEDIQMQRLMQRGLSQEDAQKRIQSQMPSYKKARFADFIIYSSGSLSDTTRQAKQVWEALNMMMCTENT